MASKAIQSPAFLRTRTGSVTAEERSWGGGRTKVRSGWHNPQNKSCIELLYGDEGLFKCEYLPPPWHFPLYYRFFVVLYSHLQETQHHLLVCWWPRGDILDTSFAAPNIYYCCRDIQHILGFISFLADDHEVAAVRCRACPPPGLRVFI